MHWIALQPLPPDRVDPASPADLPHDPLNDLGALGWWALQFSPKVARVSLGAHAGMAVDAGDALVMEVSASERLFGGQKRLLDRIVQSDKPVAVVKYARGSSSLIAIARLQLAQGSDPLNAAPRVAPDGLPLETLAAALPHLGTLARVGCTRWGELRALPRGGVVRRFGLALLDALDRAYGLKPELYPWLVLPEVFQAKLELGHQIDAAPALMFGAQRLLKNLQLWLQLRHSGVLALELGWTMDARRNTATQGALVVRTAEPTQDILHLQRLMGENLAHTQLPAPVLYLHLRTLQTEKLAGKSASLLIEDIQKGDSLHQMLERVSARLGADSVLQLQQRADHRPEHMQSWRPVFDASQLVAFNSINTKARGKKNPENGKSGNQNRAGAHFAPLTPLQGNPLYPTWLLAKPMALLVQNNTPFYLGPLTLLAGPQRIEAGWWGPGADDGDCALRDYYIARNVQTGLLWIYRERLGGFGTSNAPGTPWYLHGLFG